MESKRISARTLLRALGERLERALVLLARISTTLKRIERKEAEMSQALDDLSAQVAANTTVEQSAITLIKGIAAQLAAAGSDPAKLAELKTTLNTSATALADAVAANTPAAPTV
jgi:translation initiation factor 1 (eIF-1/SUI1)